VAIAGGHLRVWTLPVALALGLALFDAAGLPPGGSEAHEERLMVGRVQRIEPARRLLTVTDARSGALRRIELTPETEVIRCQAGAPLTAVRTGALVRVKYVDGRGEAEAQSILLIGRMPSSRLPRDRVSGTGTVTARQRQEAEQPAGCSRPGCQASMQQLGPSRQL
jgi:hypothetical protein